MWRAIGSRDCASVNGNSALRDRQPQAEAETVGGNPERLEQAGQSVFGNTRPVIDHCEMETAILARETHTDLAPLRRISQRVAQDILDSAAHELARAQRDPFEILVRLFDRKL